jgi:hypothetical protein
MIARTDPSSALTAHAKLAVGDLFMRFSREYPILLKFPKLLLTPFFSCFTIHLNRYIC